MTNKYDDLVNRYVDNELSRGELKNIEILIQEDSKFKSTLITHKYVHNNLYDIPLQTAPSNIAANIMNKIITKLSDRYNKNYFFRGIVVTLTFILITVLFMFFFYASNLKIVQESPSYISYFGTYAKPIIDYVYKVVSTDIFKMISTLFSFIILIGFYFTFNLACFNYIYGFKRTNFNLFR